jgi:beta-glucanase (GH16 family)
MASSILIIPASNGQFEQTTSTNENAFIKDGMLYLQSTLQNETLLAINNTIDLLNNGCTSTAPQPFYDCVATTNTTNGTIVNPVKSARINTMKSAAIKYGRVEVRAKLPAGRQNIMTNHKSNSP